VEVLAMKGDFLFLDIDGCLSRGKYAPFDVAAVQAQSVCAPDSPWRKWLDCGTTPLGQMLFSGCLPLTRSPLQFASAEPFLLARRSTFDYHGNRLDLLECFLPEILQFAAA